MASCTLSPVASKLNAALRGMSHASTRSRLSSATALSSSSRANGLQSGRLGVAAPALVHHLRAMSSEAASAHTEHTEQHHEQQPHDPSSFLTGQPQQQQQQQGQESVPVQQEGKSRQLQQRQGRQRGGVARRGGPAFSDLLSPWFPGERSLQQMLRSVDRMFDDMMHPSPLFGLGWPQQQQQQQSGQQGQQQGQLQGLGQGQGLGQLQGPMPGLLRGLGLDGALALRQPWDVQEDESAYYLRFDLPGMSKEEVSVHVDDSHVLRIHAEHKEESREGDVFKSRVARQYQTSFQLPEDVRREDISAKMEHGVLTVTLLKTPQQPNRPETFEVSIM